MDRVSKLDSDSEEEIAIAEKKLTPLERERLLIKS